MTQTIKVIGVIQNILITIITVYWAYQLLISIAAVLKIKEKEKIIDKLHKFLIIMPAHNEEAVIGNLVHSIQNVDYPENLITMYVIADNATDNTAKVAREAGANVVERNQPDKKTKGYALDWFLSNNEDILKKHDAIVIFDSDNIVDANFFNVMNEKLCQGEEVVQGYRDIKNPTDNWISGGYAIFYWMMNRFYHLARYNIGLSPLINGTAFMVKMNLILDSGWKTKTLTEDIEYSVQSIIKGKKLGWAKDAIVYDEQPTTFKQSWLQRERWTVGHIQVTKLYTKDIAESTLKYKKMVNLDALLYVFGIPILILTILLLVVNTLFYIIGEMSIQVLLMNYIKYIFPTFFMPAVAAYITIKLEKKPVKPMMPAIIMFPVFMGSWILINIKSLIKPNTKWVKIEHKKDVSIHDAEEHILLSEDEEKNKK